MEGKVCFISDVSISHRGGGGQTSVQRLTPCIGHQWGESFYKQEGAPCRNSTVIFRLAIGGLTRVILVVVGTVYL